MTRSAVLPRKTWLRPDRPCHQPGDDNRMRIGFSKPLRELKTDLPIAEFLETHLPIERDLCAGVELEGRLNPANR